MLAKMEMVLGERLFEDLIDRLGGVTIYLPENPKGHHPYLAVLSELEYSLLIEAIGPGRVTLPIRNSMIRTRLRKRAKALRQQGRLIRDIALELGVHERTVYRMLRE